MPSFRRSCAACAAVLLTLAPSLQAASPATTSSRELVDLAVRPASVSVAADGGSFAAAYDVVVYNWKDEVEFARDLEDGPHDILLALNILGNWAGGKPINDRTELDEQLSLNDEDDTDDDESE